MRSSAAIRATTHAFGPISARFGRLTLALPILLAAGCADAPVLDLLGGGSGLPSSGAEAGPTRRATGANREWPNLATVPERPTNFSSPAEREALRRRLEEDRAAARGRRTEPAGSAMPARQAPPALPDMTGSIPPPAGALDVPEPPPPLPDEPA